MGQMDFCGCARWARRIGRRTAAALSERSYKAEEMGRGIDPNTAALSERSYKAEQAGVLRLRATPLWGKSLAMASKAVIPTIAAALLLAALVWLAFGGATTCGFVRFDDNEYVYENPPVCAGLTWAGVRWACTTGHAANWHPLTWLAHMADVELYGLAPGGHHRTSVLIHMLNVLLLFGVLRRWTGRAGPAFLAAALWAVHPLRVESVVWISERKDVLATFFGLLALGLYGGAARRGRMAGVAAAFALSLLSKPLWVTLPGLLLLVDFWPLRRWPGVPVRELIREKWLLFLLAAVSGLITYRVQQASGAVQPFEQYPPGLRAANAVVAIWQYLYALVWPRNLACFYPYPESGIPALAVAGAFAGLAGLTMLAVSAARRQPWWLVGWLWFLGALVPMLGLVQVGGQARADRYTSLPQLGLILALVWGAAEAAERWGGRRGRNMLAALGVVLVVGLALLSQRQTQVWRDSETLFRRALAVTPDNAVAHYDLAGCLWTEGRRAEAIAHFEAALALKPDHPDVQNNLAWALAVTPDSTAEQRQRAVRLAQQAVARSGAPALDTLAAAQAAAGDFAGAVASAERARELAVREGPPGLADRIAGRLKLYEAGQPFRE